MATLTQEEIERIRAEIGYVFDPKKICGPKRYRTSSLFIDVNSMYEEADDYAVFQISKNDLGGYYNFKKLFIAIGDPSCYITAMVLLDSWKHWLEFCKSKWFIELLSEAQDELEAVLRAEAILEIQKIAKGGSSAALNAAKYLAEGKYKKELVKGERGRPKKEKTPKHLDKEKKIVQISKQETEEDYERLGLGQSGER
jgi:hypothetical protein